MLSTMILMINHPFLWKYCSNVQKSSISSGAEESLTASVNEEGNHSIVEFVTDE